MAVLTMTKQKKKTNISPGRSKNQVRDNSNTDLKAKEPKNTSPSSPEWDEKFPSNTQRQAGPKTAGSGGERNSKSSQEENLKGTEEIAGSRSPKQQPRLSTNTVINSDKKQKNPELSRRPSAVEGQSEPLQIRAGRANGGQNNWSKSGKLKNSKPEASDLGKGSWSSSIGGKVKMKEHAREGFYAQKTDARKDSKNTPGQRTSSLSNVTGRRESTKDSKLKELKSEKKSNNLLTPDISKNINITRVISQDSAVAKKSPDNKKDRSLSRPKPDSRKTEKTPATFDNSTQRKSDRFAGKRTKEIIKKSERSTRPESTQKPTMTSPTRRRLNTDLSDAESKASRFEKAIDDSQHKNEQEGIRIQKWLSQQGVASRREAEEWISHGLVYVNGKLVTEQGLRIDPSIDQVRVTGKHIHSKPPPRVYWLLHKPDLVLTSRPDGSGRRSIYELESTRDLQFLVSPVGRLDYRTEGLLLLSNDGELVHRLSHPKYKVPRMYNVLADGRLSPEEEKALRRGIALEDGPTGRAEVVFAHGVNLGQSRGAWYFVTVFEGRNRLVRRMFEYFGLKVVRLVRYGFGDLRLPDDLPPGEYRQLTAAEINYLKEAVDLSGDEK